MKLIVLVMLWSNLDLSTTKIERKYKMNNSKDQQQLNGVAENRKKQWITLLVVPLVMPIILMGVAWGLLQGKVDAEKEKNLEQDIKLEQHSNTLEIIPVIRNDIIHFNTTIADIKKLDEFQTHAINQVNTNIAIILERLPSKVK